MIPPLEAAVAHLLQLLLVFLWLLGCLTRHLPGHTVLLNESPVNRRLNELGGGDLHSIELTEACDESKKPFGSTGYLRGVIPANW